MFLEIERIVLCDSIRSKHGLAAIDKLSNLNMLTSMVVKIKNTEALEESGIARQEKRKSESRQRLMKAARQLFVERGYHETRPQDLSRLAGVGHGTFYLYFADKKACFLAFIRQTHEELDSLIRIRVAPSKTDGERLYRALEASMDYEQANPGVLKAAWAGYQLIADNDPESASIPSLSDEWAAGWANIIEQGQKTGTIWQDYDPKIIGYAVLAVTGVVSYGVSTAGAEREHFLTNLTKFILRGLAAPR